MKGLPIPAAALAGIRIEIVAGHTRLLPLGISSVTNPPKVASRLPHIPLTF